MDCPKCGNLEYEVHKTVRGTLFDLREVFCRHCKQFFYQRIERVEQKEYLRYRMECRDSFKADQTILFDRKD